MDNSSASSAKVKGPPPQLGKGYRVNELFYCFLYGWLYKNLSRTVSFDDTFLIPHDTTSATVLKNFDKLYKKKHKKKGKRINLFHYLFRLYYPPWILAQCFYFGWCVAAGLQPYLLRKVVEFLKDPNSVDTTGILLAFSLCGCGIMYAYTINWKFHVLARIGVSVRQLTVNLLHQKALRLHTCSGNTLGTLANLVSNDADKFYLCLNFFHYLYLAVLFVLYCLYRMYISIGYAALVGFGLLLLLLPLNAFVSAHIGRHRRIMMTYTDRRTKILQSALFGIQLLKSARMEDSFKQRMRVARNLELKETQTILYLEAFLRCVNFCFPSIVALFTFSSIIWFGGELGLPQCIETLAYINIVRFPLLIIPMAASNFFQARVSLSRINAFLNLPESPNCFLLKDVEKEKDLGLKKEEMDISKQSNENNEQAIFDLKNASFSFHELSSSNQKNLKYTIKKLSFQIKKGAFVGIVGGVGAGKTCLIKGLLGELKCYPNSAIKKSSNMHTSYVGQKPFIFNSTLRSNILFGLPMNQSLYFECIDASCLSEDIRLLVDNDLTEIGEHGVNLSGGQRARVAFARCLYHSKYNYKNDVDNGNNVAIFDDPLSAVDVDVAYKMFNKGLLNHLKGFTRILIVSSHVQLLEHTDMIIVLSQNGELEKVGTFDEVCNTVNNDNSDATNVAKNNNSSLIVATNTIQLHDDNAVIEDSDIKSAKELHLKKKENRNDIVVEETRQKGAVKRQVCKKHFDMAVGGSTLGWAICLLIFALYIGGQTVRVYIDVIFTRWSVAPLSNKQIVLNGNNVTTVTTRSKIQSSFIQDAAILVGLNVCIALTRAFFGVYLAIRSSKNLHESAINCLFNAPLLYFQQNPVGRVLNRLSADMQKSDTMLPNILYQMLDNVFTLLSCYVLAGVSCVYVFLVILPVIVVYRFIFMLYRGSGREMQRMDAVSRSPINVAFDQALQSKEAIRAYGVVDYFVKDAQSKCDSQARFFLMDKILTRWSSINVNTIASIFILLLTILGTSLRRVLDTNLLSLAFVYSLQLMGMTSWTVMALVQLENELTSVERVQELLTIDDEEMIRLKKNGKTADGNPEQGVSAIPNTGSIEIVNLSLRYRENLPIILKEINAKINDGETIGIVGRTGSGKSSIMRAMLHLFESRK